MQDRCRRTNIYVSLVFRDPVSLESGSPKLLCVFWRQNVVQQRVLFRDIDIRIPRVWPGVAQVHAQRKGMLHGLRQHTSGRQSSYVIKGVFKHIVG